MKNIINHHWGTICQINKNTLEINLVEVRSYDENKSTIRKMVDWAIKEDFIKPGNYSISVPNEFV